MNEQDDPYQTLNLPRSATQAQIKASYRKLALKYHPDKQTNANEEDKKRCSEQFAKIGNAYEILSDPDRRSEYDRFGTVSGDGSHADAGYDGFYNPFGGMGMGRGGGGAFGGGDPFMNDPFFARHNQQHQQFHQQHGGFMDPFDLFRSVFADELNGGFGGFGDDRGGGAGFNNGFGHGRGDPMGGLMGRHMDMMNSMMNMQSSFGHGNVGGNGGNMNQGFSSYSSSSSNTFGGGGGGTRESVSTSTRIINGKRQTITERTIVKPDGTVERTTETTGDDDFPAALGYGAEQAFAGNNQGRYLPDSSGQQQQQQQQQGGHHRFFGSNRGR